MLNICSYTGSNWMAPHRCGFFHVSSNRLMLNIRSHTANNWTVCHSVNSFMLLQITWFRAFVVTLRQLKGSSPCAFFWVSSKCLLFIIWRYNGNNLHNGLALFYVFSNGLMLSSSHTGSNWRASHCCGFFHVFSNRLMLNICSHTANSWMVCHQCELFHASSKDLI